MNDITYRQATKNDFDECLEVNYSAFKDYSLYQVYDHKSEKKQQKFNKDIMRIQLSDGMDNDTVMVAEHDGKIIGVTIIQDEYHKEPSVLKYIISYGGLTALIDGGYKNTFGFLDMMDECNAPRLEYAKNNPTYNLELIAIDRKYAGKGIGSRMINECVIPFVKKRGAKRLTLITNAKNNTFFYKKNGFEVIHHNTKTYNNRTLDNWVFKRDIENNIN